MSDNETPTFLSATNAAQVALTGLLAGEQITRSRRISGPCWERTKEGGRVRVIKHCHEAQSFVNESHQRVHVGGTGERFADTCLPRKQLQAGRTLTAELRNQNMGLE